eukprot:5037857-Pyramimonas_sp.AAC.1
MPARGSERGGEGRAFERQISRARDGGHGGFPPWRRGTRARAGTKRGGKHPSDVADERIQTRRRAREKSLGAMT